MCEKSNSAEGHGCRIGICAFQNPESGECHTWITSLPIHIGPACHVDALRCQHCVSFLLGSFTFHVHKPLRSACIVLFNLVISCVMCVRMTSISFLTWTTKCWLRLEKHARNSSRVWIHVSRSQHCVILPWLKTNPTFKVDQLFTTFENYASLSHDCHRVC